uniref:RxLR effector candidate protein n=1 Tax=Hyaloperonospora arabidopsidis (strain Emoy2) TaxID=559515 RepID=M4BRW0_HYAAE
MRMEGMNILALRKLKLALVWAQVDDHDMRDLANVLFQVHSNPTDAVGRHRLQFGASETFVGQEVFRSLHHGASRDRKGGGKRHLQQLAKQEKEEERTTISGKTRSELPTTRAPFWIRTWATISKRSLWSKTPRNQVA